MNLSKLFEIQKVLDDRIMDEHPDLKGQDNLDWKVLALQVELGECANEWRGFKKWSHDQVPRVRVMKPDTWENLGCPTTEEELNAIDDKCWRNPLLEEYVDCLHFVLSIGLEIGHTKVLVTEVDERLDSVLIMFHQINADITDMFWGLRYSGHCDFNQLFSHFIGLGEMLGFTWDQIEQAYLEKNEINHKRQEEGY